MGARHGAVIIASLLTIGLLLIAGGFFMPTVHAAHMTIGTMACLWIIASAITAHYTEKEDA